MDNELNPMMLTLPSPEPVRKINFDWLADPPCPVISPFQQFFLDIDWTTSPLGLISEWTPWLKNMVLLVIADPNPALLYVDNEHGTPHALIYNEALCPLIGDKHPSLQGQDPKIGFAEIWDTLNDIFVRGRQNYETVIDSTQPLLLHRHGFTEETWWFWRFMPVLKPDGFVGASYVTCGDETRDFISKRRSTLLHDLDSQVSLATGLSDVWQKLRLTLEPENEDIPFALIYAIEMDEYGASSHSQSSQQSTVSCKLEAGIGEGVCVAAPKNLCIDASTYLGRVFQDAMESHGLQKVSIKELPVELARTIKSRYHDEPYQRGIVFPIQSPSAEKTFGFMFVAHNPRIFFNDDYRNFITSFMKQIGSIANRFFLSKQLSLKTEDVAKIQAKYSRLASRAPVGVASLSPDGSLEYANNYWHQLTQYSGEPRDGPLAWLQCVAEEDRELTLSSWTQVIASKTEVQFQFQMMTPRRLLKPNAGPGNITVLCNTFPDLDKHGNLQSVMSCITDVSELKDLEDRLRTRTREVENQIDHVLTLKKQQEDFIDMTSHEIRNPLSAVLHLAEEIYTASKEVLEVAGLETMANFQGIKASLQETAEAAETIVSCTLHQKRIVDDVCVVSRMESDSLHITPVPTRPVTLITGSLRLFEAEMRSMKATLVFSEDASIKDLDAEWLMLDPNRVLQILINLLGNAVKFTKTQETRNIEVIIKANLIRPSDLESSIDYVPVSEDHKERQETNAENTQVIWLSLSVRDSGPGLSPDEKGDLFQKFIQGSKKTHTRYGGSGLGLWISKQLTELHGGQIGFISEEGKGSNFSFFIRTTRTTAPESLKVNILTAETAAVNGQGVATNASVIHSPQQTLPLISKSCQDNILQLDVLIVEDNVVNQRVITRQLRKLGCNIHVANHGLEALEFLKTTIFWAGNDESSATRLSIVLMDIEMPLMDGITTIREIRKLENDGRLKSHVPVLAVTANARGEQLEEALEAGMDDCITKPYQVAQIMAKMRNLVLRIGV